MLKENRPVQIYWSINPPAWGAESNWSDKDVFIESGRFRRRRRRSPARMDWNFMSFSKSSPQLEQTNGQKEERMRRRSVILVIRYLFVCLRSLCNASSILSSKQSSHSSFHSSDIFLISLMDQQASWSFKTEIWRKREKTISVAIFHKLFTSQPAPSRPSCDTRRHAFRHNLFYLFVYYSS